MLVGLVHIDAIQHRILRLAGRDHLVFELELLYRLLLPDRYFLQLQHVNHRRGIQYYRQPQGNRHGLHPQLVFHRPGLDHPF